MQRSFLSRETSPLDWYDGQFFTSPDFFRIKWNRPNKHKTWQEEKY